jgi:hypothetical protein
LAKKGQHSLDIFKDRFASTQDLLLVFSTCAVPIYVWSILNMLHKVPAWLMQFDVWDLIGVIAYTQVFTLIETMAVFLALVLLGTILPAWLLRDRFAAQASIVVLLSAALVILAHLNNMILPYLGGRRELTFPLYMASIGIFYVGSIGAFNVLIRRHKKLENLIRSLANRLIAISSIYVTLSLLSVVVVILRNVQ